ncbi:MAG: cation diffusion facilitator family transporter [Gammaproteobacteria bacterium]|nr:cation diffusion facilitator family transporter [Gammaproteobacteria bacterium]MDX2459471.1 cation diffusion facilitator family transporter [Gammaproteobacteria bacterium]
MAAGSTKIIIAALIGNALIAVTKFAAAAYTGSSAMLSEGVHSLVDTGNQVLLLFGLKQSRKPPDEDFPFGHGKEIYFWSFVVAILLFAVGAGVSFYEGVVRVVTPHPVENVFVNYIVLGFAMIFEGAAWYLAFKEFGRVKGSRGYIEAVRQGKDPSFFVVLFEDSAAMLGLLVAFVGVWLGDVTGNSVFDGIASMIIGLILGGAAVWLAYETKGLLIGERANREVVDGIRRLINTQPSVRHVNEVLTMHMGPEFILVNVSVDFSDNIRVGEIEETVARMDHQIKANFPNVKRVFVEAEARRGWKPRTTARG